MFMETPGTPYSKYPLLLGYFLETWFFKVTTSFFWGRHDTNSKAGYLESGVGLQPENPAPPPPSLPLAPETDSAAPFARQAESPVDLALGTWLQLLEETSCQVCGLL